MPEQAVHTPAHDRIEAMRNCDTKAVSHVVPVSAQMPPDGWLCQLTLSEGPQADVRDGLRSQTPWRASDKGLLPIRLEDYLSLLDWIGRQLRDGKLGAIPSHLAPILERLSIRPNYFIESIRHFEQWFGRAIGNAQAVLDIARRSGCRWLHGIRQCAAVFG